MQLTTTDFLRQRFNSAQALAKTKGRSAESSFLRVDAIPTAGSGQLSFDIAARNGANPGERKLSINDTFVVSGIGLYVATGITAKPGTEKLETYPVALGASAVASPSDWFAIYNGFISVKTTQTVNFEAIAARTFLHIPQTQPVNVLNSLDAPINAGLIPEYDALESLWYPPEEVTFDGSNTPEITLTFPGNAAASYASLDAVNNNSKLSLMFFGYLIKGVSGLA